MAKYYLNRSAQPNGDHEVHKDGCVHMPDNKIYLGDFGDCREAVQQAKKNYAQINGCIHCSNTCHTQ